MKKLVLLPLLSILSLLPFSYVTYAADFSCQISHGSLDCTEEKEIDYKAAGKGLRILFDWLNENSTTNSNSSNNSGGSIPHNAYKSGNSWKCVSGYEAWNGSCRRTKAYNSSINCSKGYKKVGSSCVYIKEKAVYIPPNAYASGNSFKCVTGYKKSGNSCIKNKKLIPANAIAYQDGWKCKYGFFKWKGTYCAKLPSNSYALIAGGFKCNKGYLPSGNQCQKDYAPNNPSNSYVLSSGEWKCNTGFKKSGNKCIKNYYVPLNGYASGSSFKCITGFKKSGIQCLANEEAPNNSYVLSSGEWKCNSGFEKIGNECLLSKVSNEGFLEDTNDYLEEIKKAKVLLDSGVITETEFKEIKKRIINKI